MRRPLFFFLLNMLILLPLGGQAQVLKSEDVTLVMQRLFQYHIDKKEMSHLIAQRSLKIYVTHFDPSHSYLYLEEAQSYLHPTEDTLHTVMRDYHNSSFDTYFRLNETIQQSIVRARVWREIWERDPVALVHEAKQLNLESSFHRSFAVTKKDLQKRQKERLVKLIAYLMFEFKQESYEGKESKVVDLCEKQLRQMENQYLGLNDSGEPLLLEQQEHQVIQRTIKALAYSLDAHTAYFSPDEAHAMKVQLEKGMCGIGVVLREGFDGITIHDIVKGGPAYKGEAVQPGDTIVEVNGENVRGASFRHVLDVMRGKAGSRLRLGILREQEVFQVELTRAHISIDDKRVDVEAEPFGEGYIGRVTLYSFYDGENGVNSEKDLKEAIRKLKAKGPLHGIVLDMRENTGGFLTQAVKVGGMFISNGVVVISKYSDGSEKYFRTVDGQKAFDGPIVVLISKNSASAAEIVAQALQDYGVAIVVGDEQTYGKGTIQHQTITDKKSDSFFKVTVGRYYTASGKSTQIHGVKSDIIIPTALHFEEIGESYLEYPLSADHTQPVFDDPLTDIDPFARKWFVKYYLPSIEQVHSEWTSKLPILKANSEERQKLNRNFQLFLKKAKEHKAGFDCGSNDLQMDEAVNILKDMIYLSSEQVWELNTH